MRWLAAVVLIVACEKTDTPPDQPPPDPLHGIELPEVAGPGYVAAKGDPSILVTTRGFVIDGMAVVSLTNGDVAPDEKEGGALGMKIGRLTTMGAKLAAKHLSPPLVIAFDRHLTYHLLVETLFSLKQKESGWKDFALLAKHGASIIAVPITLPDKRAVASDDLGARVEALRSGGDAPPVHGGAHPTAKIQAAPIGAASTLTADIVVAKIRAAYMAGLRRCLRASASSTHDLALALTVSVTGRAVDPHASGDPASSRCVEEQMQSWRFPIPKTSSGDAVASTYRISVTVDGLPPPVAMVDPVMGEPDDVKPVVSLTRDNIMVWSITGIEGTIGQPKITIPRADPSAMTKLSAALSEIVHRRWPQQRPDDSRTIIVMSDGSTPIQIVAEIFGAVRAAADGSVLFPDLLLSSGFE